MRLPLLFAASLALILAAIALLLGTQGGAIHPSGDAAQGRAYVAAHCAGCHGLDGNSGASFVPRLAGQEFGYLYRQLHAFAGGERASSTMATIASAMSDSEMRDASAFFAGQTRRGDAPGAAAVDDEGRRLFLQGSDNGRVPACAACHDASSGWFAGDMHGMHGGGMAMMGMSGRNGPRLLGQRAAYVEQRLLGFSDGTPEAERMTAIAHTMTAQQRHAVAVYIAAHP